MTVMNHVRPFLYQFARWTVIFGFDFLAHAIVGNGSDGLNKPHA
jgi:hypothetical protein